MRTSMQSFAAMARSLPLRRLTAAGVLLATLACAPSAPPGPALPAGGRHRVQVSPEGAAALLARGARLVADYGSFQILDASPAAVAALPAGTPVEYRNEYHLILLNAGAIDTSLPAPAAMRAPVAMPAGKALHLVQFAAPVLPDWMARLEASGARVVTYIPSNAFLVWGDAPALDVLHASALAAPEVQWDGPYLDDYKLHPDVPTAATSAFAVQLVEDAAVNAETLALVRSLQTAPEHESRALGYVNLVVRADLAAIYRVVRRPDVISIQPWFEPTLRDERQDMIVAGQLGAGLPTGPGYLAWLGSKGFTQAQFDGSGFGVDVSDSGVDNGTTLPNHFGLYRLGDVLGTSRVAYARLQGNPHSPSTLQGCDGHGTIDAHIVAGYDDSSGSPYADAQGFHFGLGVAPFVRVGSSVVFDPTSFTYPVYEDLQSRAYAAGMRVSTNSWGAAGGWYSMDSQRYDALVRDAAPVGSAAEQAGNQEMVIVFSAGNNGPYSSSVGNPGTAKNVITVGASENVQPFGAPDLCGVADALADAAMDVASFSSRGPTYDGRKKPDLLAPGTHVSGGVAQADGQRANPPATATGQAIACFTGNAVCGGPGSDFFPPGQQWYTTSTGTSHSAPAVAGAAALVRQYFINQALAPPSPAMTKAFLVNAARYMTGAGAGDSLFSNSQGMGLLDLGAAFDGVPRTLRDQDPADLFTASGQARTFSGYVADASQPFRVTLAWTDAPGSTTGSAWNNDLDLTVAFGGATYRGNVFLGASSATGGATDSRDNLESVFLPAGLSGAYTVTVTAANINSDGVPGNGSALDQDFALVVYNTCATAPSPAPAGVTVTASADNQATLSWTPNGAASYGVYRSTTAGGPYARVATPAAPPYVDTGLSGGVTYYYVIRSRDCAESAPSLEVSVTTTGPCLLVPTFAGLQSAATTGWATCGNALAWAAATPRCGGTVAYDVYRSTTSGFVPSPANLVAGVAGTSYTDSGALVGGTTYYYVVRASETTAGFTVEDPNTVERSATPMTGSNALADDFDANRPVDAGAWWIERVIAGADQLALVSGCRYQSQNTAYRFGAANGSCGGWYPGGAQNLLLLGGDGSISASVNGLAIPAGDSATLAFRTWYSMWAGSDGAYLVYSTTGANGTFTAIPDTPTAGSPYIVSGLYDQPLGTGGQRAWTGARGPANGSLNQVLVNLDALAGRTVWIGWRFAGTYGSYEGFYLDDVRLDLRSSACSTTPVPPGPVARFRINGFPTSVVADGSAAFVLTAVDLHEQPVTTYGGTVSFTSSDPAAVLPASAVFASGVATATVRFRKAGSQTVVATDIANAALRGSGGTLVTPGPATSLAFSTQPSSTQAGFYTYPVVSVLDAFGNLATSTATVALSFASNPGGGVLSGILTTAATNGVASFVVSTNKAAKGYTLAASSTGLTGAVSAPFDVTPGYFSTIGFVQVPPSVAAGDPMTPPVTVAMLDSYGNQTTSNTAVTVTVSLAANPAGATLGGTLSAAMVNGVATFSTLWLDKAASGYQLAASSSFLYPYPTPAPSAPFDVTGGPPQRVALSQQPTNVGTGAPFVPTVTARLLDRFGNATPASNVISVSLVGGPSGARLLGQTAVAATGGSAGFPSLAVDRPGGPYALYASSPGLLGDTSAEFAVFPAAAASYSVAGPAQATAGTETAFTIMARDSQGNLATGYGGKASLASSDPQAQVPATVGFANGVSDVVPVTFRTAGQQTLSATDVSLAALTGSASVKVAAAPKTGCGCGSAGAPDGAAILGLMLLGRQVTRRRRLR